jgi:basic amino acid/polyamine antiporter, APA family
VFCLMLGVPIYMWIKVGRGAHGETAVVPVGSARATAMPTAL